MYIHSSLAGAKLRSTTMYGTSGSYYVGESGTLPVHVILNFLRSPVPLLLYQLYPFVWVLEPCAVLLANMDTPWVFNIARLVKLQAFDMAISRRLFTHIL